MYEASRYWVETRCGGWPVKKRHEPCMEASPRSRYGRRTACTSKETAVLYASGYSLKHSISNPNLGLCCMSHMHIHVTFG